MSARRRAGVLVPPVFDQDDTPTRNAAAGAVSEAGGSSRGGPPAPVVWAALSGEEAESEWRALNEWVEDLRQVFCLPAQVVPPFWHRHQLLVEHLSALRCHWLAAFDPAQHASAPFGWIRDLDEWKLRMREAVAALGTRVDQDRPHQAAPWPGEPAPDPEDAPPPVDLADRRADFLAVVAWDVARRRAIEARFYQLAADANPDDDPDHGDGWGAWGGGR